MKFRGTDELLAASVVTDNSFVFIVTEGGYAKRTAVEEYRLQGRGGLGIKVAKLVEDRGDLVGALIVQEDDEVLVVMSGGKVVRSAVAEVPAKGRDTMGVIFAKPDKNDRIIEVARNTERGLDNDDEADDGESGPSGDPADAGAEDAQGSGAGTTAGSSTAADDPEAAESDDQGANEVPLSEDNATSGGND